MIRYVHILASLKNFMLATDVDDVETRWIIVIRSDVSAATTLLHVDL